VIGIGAPLREARRRRGFDLDEVARQARIPRHYLAALEDDDLQTLPAGTFRTSYRRQYMAWLGLPPLDEDLAELYASPPEVPGITREGDTVVNEGGPQSLRRLPIPGPAAAVDLDEDDGASDREEPGSDPGVTSTSTIPRHEEVPMLRLVGLAFVGVILLMLALQVSNAVYEAAAERAAAPLPPPVEEPVQAGFAREAEAAEAAAEPVAEVVVAGDAPPEVTDAPGAPVHRIRIRAIEPVTVLLTADDEIIHKGTLPAGEVLDAQAATEISADINDLTRVTVTYNEQRIEPLHNLTHGRRLVFATPGGR